MDTVQSLAIKYEYIEYNDNFVETASISHNRADLGK